MEFKKHINNSKINKYDATINAMFVNNTTVIFYDSPINYGGFSRKIGSTDAEFAEYFKEETKFFVLNILYFRYTMNYISIYNVLIYNELPTRWHFGTVCPSSPKNPLPINKLVYFRATKRLVGFGSNKNIATIRGQSYSQVSLKTIKTNLSAWENLELGYNNL